MNHKFDVICLTEFNLKDREQVVEYFKNYKTFYSGRSNRQGGGVMVCMSECFDCEIIPQLTTNLAFIEIVTVKIKFFNKQFFVSSIYTPPKTNFELFNKFIGEAFASESLQN